MSGRWWLPNQKGTQLWPRTTAQPPKLVVEGVRTGTPIYRAVAAHFAGRLKTFHAKAQQMYALSPTEIGKLRMEWPDGRAQYINIQGQEYIKLEVDFSVLEGGKTVTEDFWDFALIELVVPSMPYDEGASQLNCYAHLTSPIEQRLEPTDVWPVRGVAGNVLTRDAPDPMINASETDDFNRTVTDGAGEAIASFTVDLRPARGFSAVTVDLHPYIYAGNVYPNAVYFKHDDGDGDSQSVVPVDGYVAANYNNGPINNLGPVPLNNVYDVVFYSDGGTVNMGYNAYPGEIEQIFHNTNPVITLGDYTIAVRPAIHYDPSIGWVFDATGTKFYDEYMGDTRIIDSAGTIVSGGWYRHWYVDGASAGIYSGPAHVPGDVQITLFKGVPDLDNTKTEGPGAHSYCRWSYPAIFPRRVGSMTIAEDSPVPVYMNIESPSAPGVPFPTPSGTVSDIYGVPKLGTVIINLRTDLGVSWQAEA